MTGQDFATAKATLEGLGFVVKETQIAHDSTTSGFPNFAAAGYGEVLAQNVASGTDAAYGATITLTTKGYPATVELGNYVKRTDLEAAKAQLQAAGFAVVVRYVEEDRDGMYNPADFGAADFASIADDTIIGQSPRAGVDVDYGSTVTLSVKGKDPSLRDLPAGAVGTKWMNRAGDFSELRLFDYTTVTPANAKDVSSDTSGTPAPYPTAYVKAHAQAEVALTSDFLTPRMRKNADGYYTLVVDLDKRSLQDIPGAAGIAQVSTVRLVYDRMAAQLSEWKYGTDESAVLAADRPRLVDAAGNFIKHAYDVAERQVPAGNDGVKMNTEFRARLYGSVVTHGTPTKVAGPTCSTPLPTTTACSPPSCTSR